MSEKIIAGEVKCQDCGRSVELRVNKGGRAYYRCDGAIAEEACNASHTYGPGQSKKVLAAANAQAPAPAKPPPVSKPATPPKPKAPPAPTSPPPPAMPDTPQKKDAWTW